MTLNQVAKQDTAHGEPLHEGLLLLSDAGSNQTWKAELSAGSQPKLTLTLIKSDGTTDTTASRLELDLSDLPLAPNGLQIKFRETQACTADGTLAYCIEVRSQFYSEPIGSDFS